MILICTMGAKAQIGEGFDYAMNLGGVGLEVVDMQYDGNGNLYFVADIMGKALFAGQQIDAGGRTFANTQHIYGKISPNGTQTLLKAFNGSVYCKISNSGELYGIIESGYPFWPTDFGNGFTDAAYGAKMIKISNTGVTQWIKPLDPGSSWEYGKAGQGLKVANMQITPDGNVYTAIDANQEATNPPNAIFKFPHRISKYNSDGIEIWHTDVFDDGGSSSLVVPNLFVTNSGKVTVGVFSASSSRKFYYNGEEITSQMSKTTISSSIVISLNADGTKNFAIADVSRNTNNQVLLQAVNPFNGDIFVSYQAYFVKPENAPYNSFPTSTPNPNISNYIGVINFNSSGTYIKYDNNYSSTTLNKSLNATNNGFVNVISSNDYNKGGYVFSDTNYFGVVEIYDQNFNFSKAVKIPYVDNKLSVAGFQDKVAIGGTFLKPLTIGNTTLTPQYNDPDFGTRFIYNAGIKFDVFFAQANVNTVTPITLLSFNGVKSNTGIKLNWVTAAEKNTAYFEIQKSSDLINFTSIGRVDAAGNSSENKYYSLTDFIPAKGINYYRLNQIDADGTKVLSNPIAINFDLNADTKISVYPNPAVNEIHFTGLKTGATVSLFNTEGKNILSQKLSNNTLQIPAIVKSGLYILSVKAIDGSATTLKVSIVK